MFRFQVLILLRAGSHSVLFEASASATTIVQTSSSSRPLPRQKRHLGITSPKVWLIVTPCQQNPKQASDFSHFSPRLSARVFSFCRWARLCLCPSAGVTRLQFLQLSNHCVFPSHPSRKPQRHPRSDLDQWEKKQLPPWVSINGLMTTGCRTASPYSDSLQSATHRLGHSNDEGFKL